MTALIVVRHGETDWNRERRMQGHRDIGLNATGVEQAKQVAAALAGEAIDAIVSSDLQRALVTAQTIAAAHRLPVATDSRLRERSFGRLEGLTLADAAAQYPDDARAWSARDPDFAPVGGESLAQQQARVLAAVAEIADAGHRCALIVAHGGVLDCLYRAANGLPLSAPRDYPMRNATINRLRWQHGQLQMEVWDDGAHLDNACDEIGR